jgi:lysyl-tRNA synthetase class 1
MISGGLTTSGPTHLGTVCEFLFPQTITNALKFEGKAAAFYFVADIFDAFDSIPSIFEKYRPALEPHLGKPLSLVPDPTGQAASFGDHFLKDAQEAMQRLGVSPQIIRATDLYSSGSFDKYARIFLEHDVEVRGIVARTSLRESLPDWWSPIMPLCQNCGKIATTRVTSHVGDSYSYTCDRDVKYTRGCGFFGQNSLLEHKYKLTWRLHWPAWMDHFNTSCEGGGVDHFTKGGSRDTAVEIFQKIFHKAPPIGYKFGFILFEGKKYSKSKGVGMGVGDLLALLPPEVLKYMLIKPDLEENVDIVPTPQNFLRIIDEFESISRLSASDADPDSLARSERKKLVAYRLCSQTQNWSAPFVDVLLYWQLYGDFGKAGELLNDKTGVEFLSTYLREWQSRGFIPSEYLSRPDFSPPSEQAAIDYLNKLDANATAEGAHTLVFGIAKEHGMPPAKLFELLYLSILNKPRGPKLGKLVTALGATRLKKELLK